MERLRDGCLPKLNADVDTLKRELEQVFQAVKSTCGERESSRPGVVAGMVIKGSELPHFRSVEIGRGRPGPTQVLKEPSHWAGVVRERDSSGNWFSGKKATSSISWLVAGSPPAVHRR